MEPETGTPPPSTDPVPQPSSTDEKIAALTGKLAVKESELEKANRSYAGLDGNFKSVKEERDNIKAQLEELKKLQDAEKLLLTTENTTLKTDLEEKRKKLEDLEANDGKTKQQLEAFQLLLNDYPDLVPAFSKKLIRIEGLTGDDLKNYLETWKSSLAETNLQNITQRNSGTSVPPPNQDISSISLEEASEKKLAALREKGSRSPEYEKWSTLEAELIRTRKK